MALVTIIGWGIHQRTGQSLPREKRTPELIGASMVGNGADFALQL